MATAMAKMSLLIALLANARASIVATQDDICNAINDPAVTTYWGSVASCGECSLQAGCGCVLSR